MDTSAPTVIVTMPVIRARKTWASTLLPYALVAPTLVLVMLFTTWPALKSLADSTLRPPRNVEDPSTFVGLQNYVDVFTPTHHIGARFTRVLANTLIFAALTVAVSVPLALGFALLLNRRIRFMSLWRFSLFYPSLLPLIGAASIWAFIYSDTLGLLNALLRPLGVEPINWLGDTQIVLYAVTFVNIWKQVGYFMIFYLAGLQSIPRDIYEAAELDGVTYWQGLRFLTLPLLRRTTLFVLITALTFAFQTVEQLQALGEGGPGDSSNLMLYFIFQNIAERRNWGYVNAMTVILVAIVMLFTVGNFIYFERGREDER
jgi:sn-glycerol 3-phosphate transport system permease protein